MKKNGRAQIVVIEDESQSMDAHRITNASASQLTVHVLSETDSPLQDPHRLSIAAPFFAEIRMTNNPKEGARQLYAAIKKHEASRIYIFGEPLADGTEEPSQRATNEWMHAVLELVHAHLPIGTLISDARPGIGIAVATAAHALQVSVAITQPKGFWRRNKNGDAYQASEIEILTTIKTGANIILTGKKEQKYLESISTAKTAHKPNLRS